MNLFEAVERRTILTSHNWISPLITLTATVLVIIFQGLDVGLLFSRFALGFVLFVERFLFKSYQGEGRNNVCKCRLVQTSQE